MHVAALKASLGSVKMTIHPLQAAQTAVFKQDEAPTKFLSKYADYADIFSFDLAMELPKNNGINKYAIEL